MTPTPLSPDRQTEALAILADLASMGAKRRVTLRDHVAEIDPGPWLDWWHVGKMLEACQALLDGEIENLMINAPPRTWKSRIAIQGMMSCCLRNEPREKIKVVCAADDLVEFHSRHIRDHVLASGVTLRGDSRAVKTWETSEGGLFKAETIGALRKGFGWSMGGIDDPFRSRRDGQRPLVQREVWRAYREDFLDRREARPGGGVGGQLLMHQRLDRRDHAGRLRDWLEEDGQEVWHFLVLKGYAERSSIVVPEQCVLVEDDRNPGEPLCDSEDLMREIDRRRRTDPGLSRAQDQQDPVEESSGGVFCGRWFRVVKPPGGGVFPEVLAALGHPDRPTRKLRGWDFSTGTGVDSTASARGGPCGDINDLLTRWLWEDVTESKIPSARLEAYVLDTAEADGKGVEVVLPNEVAMGKAFSDRVAAALIARGFTVHIEQQREPKRSRALGHAGWAAAICSTCSMIIVPLESAALFQGRLCKCDVPGGDGYGRVDMVEAPWNADTKTNLNQFTGLDGGDDDVEDAMAVAFNVGTEQRGGGPAVVGRLPMW